MTFTVVAYYWVPVRVYWIAFNLPAKQLLIDMMSFEAEFA
jgi:hypothetical protein